MQRNKGQSSVSLRQRVIDIRWNEMVRINRIYNIHDTLALRSLSPSLHSTQIQFNLLPPFTYPPHSLFHHRDWGHLTSHPMLLHVDSNNDILCSRNIFCISTRRIFWQLSKGGKRQKATSWSVSYLLHFRRKESAKCARLYMEPMYWNYL